MNYQELMIHNQYSTNAETILKQLLVPSLLHTVEFRIAINNLDSLAVKQIFNSLVGMARAKGIIKIIYYPVFHPDEKQESDSVSNPEDFQKIVKNQILSVLSQLTIMELKILLDMANNHLLQIQYGLSSQNGTVYDQISILTDQDENTFIFRGGYNAITPDQYEKIIVFRSWRPENMKYVLSEKKSFDEIWDHQSADIRLTDFNGAFTEILKCLIQEKEKSKKDSVVKLRDYQEEARDAWLNHQGRGFLVMATGTGKTWTAIYAAKAIIDKEHILPIIVAPYKHLLKQWGEDLKKAFPEAIQIYVSSEFPGWSISIKNEIIRSHYDPEIQLIIISTIASFRTKKFHDAISGFTGKKLLIVDEAHRFSHPSEEILKEYSYMLGLSATPYRGKNAESGKELVNFFGGQVYNLPIDQALQKKCLVPYTYHPVFVHSTEIEETAFANYTQKIPGCFNSQGICTNPEYLITLLRARLRIIAMAEEKLLKLDDFLKEHDGLDHFVVYCGDGRISESGDQDKRHIEIVKEMLMQHGYTAAQFTAQESMKERMNLISAFDKGIFNALAAIRCLDEGVNIPSIKSAMILASNDDYREFVQRRGRILRKHEGKTEAKIYDMIVLPTLKTPGIAAIELRRYAEYAKLARNHDELIPELERLKGIYNLTDQDINVFEFEEQERELDE